MNIALSLTRRVWTSHVERKTCFHLQKIERRHGTKLLGKQRAPPHPPPPWLPTPSYERPQGSKRHTWAQSDRRERSVSKVPQDTDHGHSSPAPRGRRRPV